MGLIFLVCLDFDRGNFSKIERGKLSCRLITIYKVCQAFDLKFSDFAKMLEKKLGEGFNLIEGECYEITEESIEAMISKGILNSIFDEAKVFELENSLEPLNDKEKAKLEKFYDNKPLYDSIIQRLKENISDKVPTKQEFEQITPALIQYTIYPKIQITPIKKDTTFIIPSIPRAPASSLQ